MKAGHEAPTTLPAWKALVRHQRAIDRLQLRALFAEDPERGERLGAEAAGLYLDYSKNLATDETRRLLFDLAGKALATHIIPELGSREDPKLAHDGSTNALIRRYRRLRSVTGPNAPGKSR
jgi:hypothetical protein